MAFFHINKGIGVREVIRSIDFRPLMFLGSAHLQTICAQLGPCGRAPESLPMIVPLEDGDKLSCEVSTPPTIAPYAPTIVLVHGLGEAIAQAILSGWHVNFII